MAHKNDVSKNGPVTVIAKHSVLPGKEKAFEAWVAGISKACTQYEGYLGTEIIRPTTDGGDEHVCIFRFDSFLNLEKWMGSKERASWASKQRTFINEKTEYHQYQSIDFWFESKPDHSKPPSRHKMALVSFFAIWLLVHIIIPVAPQILPGPELFHEIVIVAVIVTLMTYVIMPVTTKVLSKWLFNT